MREISPWRDRRLTPIADTKPAYIYSPESEEPHLRDYWKVLVKRRRQVILVFLTILGLGAYYTFSLTPLYTAGAALRIEPENPAVMKIEEVLSPHVSLGGQYDYYQTQFALLKSRALAAKVITQLGLEGNKAFTTVPTDPLGWLYGLRDRLFDLLEHSLTRVSNLLGSPPMQEEKPPPVSAFESGVHPWLINRYLSMLNVTPVRETRLVQVLFTTPAPDLSQELANAHAAAFIRMTLETRFELTKDARQFLEKKLAELKAKVVRAEGALNRFRQKRGVVSLEGNENIVVERMVDVNKRLTEATARRIELESLNQMVSNKNSSDLSQVMENNLIQDLKGRLATLEAERARLSSTFKAPHPRLMELNEQAKEVRQLLNREIATIVRRIKSDYNAAVASERALQAEAKRQQGAALDLKEVGAEYTVLQEDVTSNRTLYESVLKRLNETIVSNEIAVSNMQITERAESPMLPSFPQKQRYLLLAAVGGLLFSVGLAFFREHIDSAIRTPEDVWRAIAVPALGVVPHLSALRDQAYGYGRMPRHASMRTLPHPTVAEEQAFSRELMVAYHPLSFISEAYRTIRTSLLLSQAEKPPQAVLLTSPRSGDGKTVTTLNLAITLVQMGHRVVVVDGDLRRGNCHTLLHLPNRRGLTNVLTGTLALEEGIQSAAVTGLSLLSRGTIPPNPPDLLGSPKMREVMGVLRDHFDFVLIDSPPAIAVSDAAVLSDLCDGVLLVLRGQETTAETARRLVERLEAVRARILGVVLNGVDMRHPDYSDYRAYYTSYYAGARRDRGAGRR